MKVYIMGPKQLADSNTIPFYEQIVAFTKNYFDEVVCTYPDFWDSKLEIKENYAFMKNMVKGCDLLIAELSTPATGLGVQLEWAVEFNIPVIGILKKGEKASSLAAGLPKITKILEYNDQKELEEMLGEELGKF